MSNPAISIRDLGKAYLLSHEQKRGGYRTLRDDLVEKLKSPFKLLRQGFQKTEQEVFWALQDINFDIQPGEVVGIIGRNGAGKSTLLKILSRITKPTLGRCELHGRVGSLLEVGTGFHPELSGRENIFMNGSILGMSRQEIRKHFDDIVAFAEVERFLDTPVKRYSSGMYVRLAFAVAAHLEPEILIVDEVLAVGDAQFQAKCLNKMGSVAKQGRTVLFVSHNMPAVEKLCSRAIWLQGGKLRMDSSTSQVIDEYLSNTTASSTSLVERRDRTGNGKVQFTHFQTNLQSAAKQDQLQSGKRAFFTLNYVKPKDEFINRVQFAVIVRDQHDAILFTLSTHLLNESYDLHAAQGAVQVCVERLPLNEGQYTIDLWAAQDGETLDFIQGAATFKVTAMDVFQSGRVPVPHKHGVFFVDQSWEQLLHSEAQTS